MARQRFELSKSPVDGMLRRWERKRASFLIDLITGDPMASFEDDYDVWVCTGVFKRRKDVFAAMKQEDVPALH